MSHESSSAQSLEVIRLRAENEILRDEISDGRKHPKPENRTIYCGTYRRVEDGEIIEGPIVKYEYVEDLIARVIELERQLSALEKTK